MLRTAIAAVLVAVALTAPSADANERAVAQATSRIFRLEATGRWAHDPLRYKTFARLERRGIDAAVADAIRDQGCVFFTDDLSFACD